jgi:hypothetical protein
MKVVMIRSNTYVPDVQSVKAVFSLFSNDHDVSLIGGYNFNNCPNQEHKNSYQIRRILFKAHQGFLVRENYCTLDLCNQTHFEELKK